MKKPKVATTLSRAFAKLRDNFKVFYRKFNRTIWFKVLKLVIIAGLVGAVGYALANLNIFYIQEFEVEGFAGESLVYIDPDDVESELSEYYGERLFLVSTDDIADSLSSSLPFIKKVYVTKHAPDSIQASIIEREPVLVIGPMTFKTLFPPSVESVFKHAALIDGERTVIATCVDEEDICAGLPVCLFSDTPESYELGDDVFFAELDEIIDLDSLFDEIGMSPTGYAVPEPNVVVVSFEDSSRAIFSLEAPLDEQVVSFEYTRENLALEGKKYKELDFRYERPVMRVDKYTVWMTE